MKGAIPIDPRLKLWLEVGGLLANAAEAGARRAAKALRPKRRGAYLTRKPGAESPLWNLCAAHLQAELAPLGAKVRLARFLGIPKQRLHDYLTGRTRLPDAELTLQMLNWLAHKRAGRDLSL
jgi:hypothetical protein